MALIAILNIKQSVTLTRPRGVTVRTGPPCSVSRSIAHVPGPAAADRPRARRPARPPTGSVTDDDWRQTTTPTDDDDRQQTPASKTILAQLGRPVIIFGNFLYRQQILKYCSQSTHQYH